MLFERKQYHPSIYPQCASRISSKSELRRLHILTIIIKLDNPRFLDISLTGDQLVGQVDSTCEAMKRGTKGDIQPYPMPTSFKLALKSFAVNSLFRNVKWCAVDGTHSSVSVIFKNS